MSNIKLSGHTWDTSGIYDAEQEKTQAEVNSGLKTALNSDVIDVNTSGYIKLNVTPVSLTPTSNTTYYCAVVPCSQGDAFTISGTTGIADGARLWGFVKSNGDRLAFADKGEVANNKIVYAPNGASYFIVNRHKDHPQIVYRGEFLPALVSKNTANVKTIDETMVNQNLLEYGNNLFTPFVTIFNGVSINNLTGEIFTAAGRDTSDFIKIESGENYTFALYYVVAWYDANKMFISASSSDASVIGGTLTAPNNAVYVRISWLASFKEYFNKGSTLAENDVPKIKRIFLPDNGKSFGLAAQNIKLPVDGVGSCHNLCVVAGKEINSEGKVPNCEGYLLLDENTSKFYWSSITPDNPQYIFDWDSSLAQGLNLKIFQATITADNDIIFLAYRQRINPIIYPHTDYSSPYIVDFGDDRKPFGWLMSCSIVQFDDGSFCFGDYAAHSLADEQNNVGRIIWRVSKPYNNKTSWVQAHEFKHVYYSSEESDEPDNEIGHIHAILYDFYSDMTYCTTGDIDRHCRMWKSSDHGETWAAVPGAVGTDKRPSASGDGQKWRLTSAVFTESAMWWATDSAYKQHNLWRCTRDVSGEVDFDTLTKICYLEQYLDSATESQRTYIMQYLRNPNGFLLLDRGEPRTDNKLDITFYSLDYNRLFLIATLNKATTDAGSLEPDSRIGLPNNFATIYQPQCLDYVVCGALQLGRPNNTSLFNNSIAEYVGGMKLNVVAN